MTICKKIKPLQSCIKTGRSKTRSAPWSGQQIDVITRNVQTPNSRGVGEERITIILMFYWNFYDKLIT